LRRYSFGTRQIDADHNFVELTGYRLGHWLAATLSEFLDQGGVAPNIIRMFLTIALSILGPGAVGLLKHWTF
jgi:hypothetical protein